MNRNRKVAIFLLVFGVSGVILNWLLQTGEPLYNQKSLSGWLMVAYYSNGPEQAKAEAAVRKIGTNALPFLLKMAMSRDSNFKTRYLRILPDKFRIGLALRSDSENFYLACEGFHALGTNAKAIVPLVTNLLSHEDPDIRSAAAQVLSAIGPSAEEAVPTLIQHFNDTNVAVQFCVRTALGSIHARPEMVVPLLIRNLDESNRIRANHISAMLALTNFHEQSHDIVAAVSRLKNDRDPATRACATNVLKAFADESAKEPSP